MSDYSGIIGRFIVIVDDEYYTEHVAIATKRSIRPHVPYEILGVAYRQHLSESGVWAFVTGDDHTPAWIAFNEHVRIQTKEEIES